MSEVADEVDDELTEMARTAWNLAEIVAVALVAILFIFLVTSVIGAITSPHLFDVASGFASSQLGFALEQAGEWAAPQSAAILLLGSLGLAWWQIESWTNDDGDPFNEEALVHLWRAAIVTRIDLVYSLLTIVGGVLIAVGSSLRQSPSEDWSTFSVNLGLALGAIVLGVVGVVAAFRLLASGRAAEATWHASPAPT